MRYPVFSYPSSGAISLVANIIFGGRRSFRLDAQTCIDRLKPPLKILGTENIPQTGPVLITFNHYYRRGFHAWWLALALAAAVPGEIHFGMTGELTYPGRWYAPLGRAGSRLLLRRLSGIYGFTTTPPMPPRPGDVEARARAVREFLAYARKHPQAILGLAPEGCDNPPSGALAWPAPGSGRFIDLLARLGFPILPVGALEEAGEFCLRFGPVFTLDIPRGIGAEERDRLAAETVMRRIAALLPPPLRGDFQ
jgi:hypothetical protein